MDVLFQEGEFNGGEGACKTHVRTKPTEGDGVNSPATGAERALGLPLAPERIRYSNQCRYNVARGLSTFFFEK